MSPLPAHRGNSSPASVQGKETLQDPSLPRLWVWKDRAEPGFGSGVSISGPSPTRHSIYSFPSALRLQGQRCPQDRQNRWI